MTGMPDAVGASADAPHPAGYRPVQRGPAAPPGAADLATGQGTATTTVSTIVASRAGRVSVTVVNNSTTAVILGGPAVTTGTGVILPGVVGTSLTLSYSGAVGVITTAGSAALSFYELY